MISFLEIIYLPIPEISPPFLRRVGPSVARKSSGSCCMGLHINFPSPLYVAYSPSLVQHMPLPFLPGSSKQVPLQQNSSDLLHKIPPFSQEVLWASELANNGYYIVDYSKVDVEFRRLN